MCFLNLSSARRIVRQEIKDSLREEGGRNVRREHSYEEADVRRQEDDIESMLKS